jgi:Fe-S-cluster containining protein
VIRLKKRLEMTSDEFLSRYVDVVLRKTSHFPSVLLRMADNAEKTCPYLTTDGCSVYPDRPDTCRTFPLEGGVLYNETTGQSRKIYFFRPPDFCLGQQEPDEWTPALWIKDQGAGPYQEMTAQWASIIKLFHKDPWGMEGPEGPKAKMAFMATYNMDQFREFVYKSSFLKRYRVSRKVRDKARYDDVALLKFGYAWVKFFLFSIRDKWIQAR